MTDGKNINSGLGPEMGGFAFGLSLIVWSIICGIQGLVNPQLLAFTIILPPLGSYIVITSAVDILRVIRNEAH
ncbi:MAG: hypothetical protein RTV31_10805 [Candidatus Thorarchaeota archaeon]